MIKMFCDRCGQEIKDKEPTLLDEVKEAVDSLMGNEKPSYVLYDDNKKPYDKRFMLCDSCNRSLVKWFKMEDDNAI